MAFMKLKGEGESTYRPSKRIETGTAQQEAIWSALTSASSHVLNEARAGCGKSSTCREGMWRALERLPAAKLCYTVFAKANAEEFRGDCPPGVEVGTCHSFAFQTLKRAFGSRVEKNKSYLLLDESPEGRNLPRYLRKSIASLVGQAKNQALLPDCDPAYLYDLLVHYDIHPYGRPGLIVDWARKVLKRSSEWPEVVDFDDMIWLPILYKTDFPGFDLLFLDEVQDWNPAQHALVPRMALSARVTAVGDPFQAIYAFRGADPESMPRLRDLLSADPIGLSQYPLTLTFRCPKSHVALAQQIVPDIEAYQSNPDGVIEYGAPYFDVVGRAMPGDMIICPTNAPLIKLALKFVMQRRPVSVRGRAFGDQLITVLMGQRNARTIGELASGVERWRGQELCRLSSLDGVEDVIENTNDRCDSLQAVLACCAEVNEVQPTIDSLFNDTVSKDRVILSTAHRAKGLEAETVWFVDVPGRKPQRPWEVQQGRNLRYVALTRSKQTLVFVEPEQK